MGARGKLLAPAQCILGGMSRYTTHVIIMAFSDGALRERVNECFRSSSAGSMLLYYSIIMRIMHYRVIMGRVIEEDEYARHNT